MSTKRNPSAHVNSKISFEDSAEAVAGVKRAMNSSEDGKDDVDVSENITKRAHVNDDEAEDLSKLSMKTLNEYWAFVKDINWGKTRCEKVEFDSSKQRKKYDEITRYCANLLSTRIYDEEDERGIDLCYGGADDHTYHNIPAEIVGRGRAFYNKMMKGSLEDIAAFGSTPNNVCENFSYLFYDLRD